MSTGLLSLVFGILDRLNLAAKLVDGQKIATVVLVYFFAHIQHPEEANWEEAPFQTTVKIRTGPLGKLYWLGQTDHCLHHAMPHIPFCPPIQP